MAKIVAAPTISQTNNRRQAYVLLVLGVLFLLFSWLLQLNAFAYPLGLFLFGLGMLIAAFFNPYRLMIAGILVTVIGASIFLTYKHTILPDAGSSIVLAIGLGTARYCSCSTTWLYHCGRNYTRSNRTSCRTCGIWSNGALLGTASRTIHPLTVVSRAWVTHSWPDLFVA